MQISQVAVVSIFSVCLLLAFSFLLNSLNTANNALLANGEACSSVLSWLGTHDAAHHESNGAISSFKATNDSSHRILSEFIRSIGYKPPAADDASPFFLTDKHPAFDIVIDVGAYHCQDYTITAYKRGYTVYSFELNPHNVHFCMQTFQRENLVEGDNFTVITPTPGKVPQFTVHQGKPHIYFFKAGVSNRVGGTAIKQGDVMTQVDAAASGDIPLVRIDDVVPSDSRVYVFKSDTQGHEFGVYTGAEQLLRNGKIHLLALEFWPQGSRENGFESKALLDYLYDHRFMCFDAGTHSYDKVGRPSQIHAFDAFLDAVPRTMDSIGGWEDLVCSRFES